MPQSTLSRGSIVAPPRRRRGLIAGILAAVVAVIVAVVLAVTLTGGSNTSGSPRQQVFDRAAPKIELPASFGDYTLSTNADAKRVEAVFRKGLRQSNDSDVSASKVVLGVYDTPEKKAALVVLADTARDDAVLQQTIAAAHSSKSLAVRLLNENPIDVAVGFRAGPKGGSTECGNGAISSDLRTAMCAWAGPHTIGEAVDLSIQLNPDQVAAIVRQFRAKAEVG